VEQKNQVLLSLDPADLKLLNPHLKNTVLDQGKILFDQGDQIDQFYFPDSGMISLVCSVEDGGTVELAAVGYEGFAGPSLADGTGQSPLRAIVQVAGRGARIPAGQFRAAVEKSPSLRKLLEYHNEALMAQLVRTVACNAMHAAEGRLSRWLLMVHDRVQGDTLRLTQEFLGQMLGVQRTTVTLIASALQKAGLIKYRRGRIDVLNREALEEAACECYAINRKHFERLMALPSALYPAAPDDIRLKPSAQQAP
jgi:CRP-like cAMP-binding protein